MKMNKKYTLKTDNECILIINRETLDEIILKIKSNKDNLTNVTKIVNLLNMQDKKIEDLIKTLEMLIE